MKRIITALITAVLLLIAVMGISSCSPSEFDGLDEKGYTVSVRFDANGGTFKGSDSTIIDAFNPKDNQSIKLLSPDDTRRGGNTMDVTKPECILAGWYATRTPVDENDLSKGYTYADKWDFENDTLEVDANGSYTSSVPTLTLYAAWIPYFTFEYYTEDGTKYATTKGYSITVPAWEEGEATITMGNFPKREGDYTLISAYSDAECQNELSGRLTGKWNPEDASVESSVIRIYTKWEAGIQYRIYSAEQLKSNDDLKGIYTLMNDIDFEGESWPGLFSGGKFKGVFNGCGHKISNISFKSESTTPQNGLFASIDASARFIDVSFENVEFTINARRIAAGARYGLFAGGIADGAEFTGVSIDGRILFGDKCTSFKNASDYSIYLLSGCGTLPEGISADISVALTDKAQNNGSPLFSALISENEVILEFPEN